MGPDPISVFLTVTGLVAATGFVGMYATNSPWRMTSVGKAMMTLSVSFVLLCASGLLLQLFGPNYPFRSLLRNFTYLLLNLGLWWQLVNLVVTQNRVNRLPPPRPREERQDKDRVA